MPAQIFRGFQILVKSGSGAINLQNHSSTIFCFKNGSQLHRRSGVFLRPNFRVKCFLFRINVKGSLM